MAELIKSDFNKDFNKDFGTQVLPLYMDIVPNVIWLNGSVDVTSNVIWTIQ